MTRKLGVFCSRPTFIQRVCGGPATLDEFKDLRLQRNARINLRLQKTSNL